MATTPASLPEYHGPRRNATRAFRKLPKPDIFKSYRHRVLQIPPNRNRHHFAKSTIRVLEYWNGAIALFHGPREIARFPADGTLNEKPKGQEKSRVSPLRGEPVDGVDSFGAKRPEPDHPAHR